MYFWLSSNIKTKKLRRIFCCCETIKESYQFTKNNNKDRVTIDKVEQIETLPSQLEINNRHFIDKLLKKIFLLKF